MKKPDGERQILYDLTHGISKTSTVTENRTENKVTVTFQQGLKSEGKKETVKRNKLSALRGIISGALVGSMVTMSYYILESCYDSRASLLSP